MDRRKRERIVVDIGTPHDELTRALAQLPRAERKTELLYLARVGLDFRQGRFGVHDGARGNARPPMLESSGVPPALEELFESGVL